MVLMKLKEHPAFVVSLDRVASKFAISLLTGLHWDEEIIERKPNIGSINFERLQYTLQNVSELSDLDPLDKSAIEEGIHSWCKKRVVTCFNKLGNLDIEKFEHSDTDTFHIKSRRMIGCLPEDLRKELGVFWTFDFDNWPDPYPLWSVHGREGPVILVTALIPVDRVNWQASLMCLMDWMLGDCEAELRVYKDTPVKLLKGEDLNTGEDIFLPPVNWIT
jgi:hypothetical protein